MTRIVALPPAALVVEEPIPDNERPAGKAADTNLQSQSIATIVEVAAHLDERLSTLDMDPLEAQEIYTQSHALNTYVLFHMRDTGYTSGARPHI